MSPEFRRQTRQIDVATVRGRIDEVALFELLWDPEEATSMLPTIEWDSPREKRATKMLLTCQNKTVEVSDRKKSVTLGRAEDNDLVVKGNLISRIHAKVEMRRGKFFIVDQSTNGTFLQSAMGNESFLRRDSTELDREGTIGLGRSETPGTALSIYYKAID